MDKLVAILCCVVCVLCLCNVQYCSSCPSKCLCFQTTVRCMFLHLEEIPNPSTLPNETTILDVRFNKIRAVPTGSFRGLPNLNTILLNNNQITKVEDGAFDGLEKLQYLYLYKNEITAIGSKAFEGLGNLEQLYIHFNQIETLDSKTFESLPKLERLFLHNNNIKRLPPGLFSNLKALRRLRLDSNALICDCELMWLSSMLKSNQGYTEVAGTCDYPIEVHGMSLIAVSNELHCGKPQFTAEPNDLEVEFGGTASFICKAKGDPQPDIVWLHNEQEIDSNTVTGSDHYNLLDDGTLMIYNIEESDQGTYECVARNTMGETIARPVELRTDTSSEIPLVRQLRQLPRARVRPRILTKPHDHTVVEGQSVVLKCRARGLPKPVLKWSKNDQPLPTERRFRLDRATGSLLIQGVKFEDRGLYRCTATNAQGSTSETGRLKVLVAPTFSEKPSIQNAIVGQSTFFSCQAQGKPTPQLTWLKDGRAIETGDRFTISGTGNTLWITRVKVSDRGVYDCRAQNEAGANTASAQLFVKHQLPPTLRSHPQDSQAFVGANVRFHCSVTADPPPSITWFKNGAALSTSHKYEIEANEESLLIRSVTLRDQGTYECVAENVAGSVRAFATLTVYDDNSFNRISPVFNNEVITEAVNQARQQVNSAINNTLRDLYDTSRQKTPSDLLALFRLPSVEALDLTRHAEVFERTLENLHHEIRRGGYYNMSYTDVKYEDILSPFQLSIIANLSNCAVHRRVSSCDNMCFHHKYRTFDGTCNNLRHPMWGASLTPLNRVLPPTYENGFNTPRGWDIERKYNGHSLPSARLVSVKMASSKDIKSDDDFTHMLMQWGQFIDHDLDFVPMAVSNARFSDGRHCNETCENHSPCFPIQVPSNDPRIRRHRCLGVTRSSAMCGSGMTSVFFENPIQREQINQITSYIDASNIYGSTDDEAENLRDFSTQTGYLRTGYITAAGKPLLPPNNGEPVDCQMDPNKAHIPCFQAGDHRANEQLGLLSMHTLWMRHHNYIAEGLRRYNPHWDGDMLYHEARKIVGAQLQHITYKHWLPNILGPKGMSQLEEYKQYDPNVDSTIINSFATAAFRFGHSLINPVIYRLNATFQPIREGNIPLHKAFFAPFRIIEEGGIDPILRGLFGRSAKKLEPDSLLNTELTERLFKLAHAVALDLAALNIQRGRDHGLPTYNDMREYCGLNRARSFPEFREITNVPVRRKLREMYGHPDNVDLWVGGLVEDLVPGSKLGPTLLCVLVEQFRRTRDGDRFWYENPGVFSPSQLSEIKQTTLGRVICDSSDNITQVQRDVFTLAAYPERFFDCDDEFAIPKLDLKVWAHCCQDCARAGSFHSITSHYRGKRSLEQHSYPQDQPDFASEDQISLQQEMELKRKLMMMQQQQSEEVDQQALLDEMELKRKMMMLQNGNINQQQSILDEMELKRKMMMANNNNNNLNDNFYTYDDFEEVDLKKDMPPEIEKSGDNSVEDKTTVEDVIHLSHSMMDSVDVRIEGMEEAMNNLQDKLKRVKRKVRYLEQKMAIPLKVRPRQGKSQCVDHRGNLREDQDKWKENDCKVCLCKDGRLECTVETCQVPTCQSPKKIFGQCCPVC